MDQIIYNITQLITSQKFPAPSLNSICIEMCINQKGSFDPFGQLIMSLQTDTVQNQHSQLIIVPRNSSISLPADFQVFQFIWKHLQKNNLISQGNIGSHITQVRKRYLVEQ